MDYRPYRCIASIAFGAAIAVLTSLPAAAGDNDWTKLPTRSYNVQSLKIEGLVGGLTIDVKPTGPALLEVSGVQWKVNRLSVRQNGDVLRIEGSEEYKTRDRTHWFDFRNIGKDETKNLFVHLIVPKGTAVDVGNMIGKAQIGDTYGPMKFGSAGGADSQIGNVAKTDISLAGSGKIAVGSIGGDFHAETAGSGDIIVRDVDGETHAEIAGSGSISTARIGRGAHVEIAGSGNFAAAEVNGPTHVEIAGSGSVNIAGGKANPFQVEIAGSGNVDFGGIAVDPSIESQGSGNVALKTYRGKLRTEGNVHLKTGN